MNARMKQRRGLEIICVQHSPEGQFELYYQPLASLQTGLITDAKPFCAGASGDVV